jgi:hypothetical protein
LYVLEVVFTDEENVSKSKSTVEEEDVSTAPGTQKPVEEAESIAGGGENVDEAEQGGLNLFKWKHETSTTETGWKEGDNFLLLPDKGSPKANWKQNSGRLREAMGEGKPIFDSYREPNGELIPAKGFLRAERNLLETHGWKYNPETGAWHPPAAKAAGAAMADAESSGTSRVRTTSELAKPHLDAPEIEPGVVAKRTVKGEDGTHEIKVLKNGKVLRCSHCEELRSYYERMLDELRDDNLKEALKKGIGKDLDDLEAIGEGNLQAVKGAELDARFETLKGLMKGRADAQELIREARQFKAENPNVKGFDSWLSPIVRSEKVLARSFGTVASDNSVVPGKVSESALGVHANIESSKAELEVARNSEDVTHLGRELEVSTTYPNGGVRAAKIDIDVESRGGLEWAEVKNKESFGLGSSAWSNPGGKSRGLKEQVELMLEASAQYKVDDKAPKVVVHFTKRCSYEVAEALKGMTYKDPITHEIYTVEVRGNIDPSRP